jgi:hypothetical protein
MQLTTALHAVMMGILPLESTRSHASCEGGSGRVGHRLVALSFGRGHCYVNFAPAARA